MLRDTSHVPVNRHGGITVFVGTDCPGSDRIQFVLAEKGIDAVLERVAPGPVPEALADRNPYGTTPTLVDRDLCVYDTRIIAEYLDERFPHPPLLPVDPVGRARARLVQHRIERDWYPLLQRIVDGERQAVGTLRDELVAADELFAMNTWFLSEERTLMDVALAPLLHRLVSAGGQPGGEAAPALSAYAERLFALDAYRASLGVPGAVRS